MILGSCINYTEHQINVHAYLITSQLKRLILAAIHYGRLIEWQALPTMFKHLSSYTFNIEEICFHCQHQAYHFDQSRMTLSTHMIQCRI